MNTPRESKEARTALAEIQSILTPQQMERVGEHIRFLDLMLDQAGVLMEALIPVMHCRDDMRLTEQRLARRAAIKAATGEPKEHAGEFVIINRRGEFFNGDWANIRWTSRRVDARVYTQGVGEQEVRKLSVETADADLPVRLLAATGGES